MHYEGGFPLISKTGNIVKKLKIDKKKINYFHLKT